VQEEQLYREMLLTRFFISGVCFNLMKGFNMPQDFGAITRCAIDDSYIITKNGLPYHVPNEGEWTGLWAEVNAYALANPSQVTLEEPPPPPSPPSPPTPDELEAAFSRAVNAKLLAFARAKGWDSIDRVLAQKGEFKADAETFQAAYDHTWEAALALLPQVRSGELYIEAALEQLPALEWPE
jgi:hypothetical protein